MIHTVLRSLIFLTILMFVFQFHEFTSMIELTIIALLLVACIPADGREGPKHVSGLPHVCVLL